MVHDCCILKLGHVVLCNVYCLEKKMNRISMLSMAISLMAGFVYAEEAKAGDVTPASDGATATPAEATPVAEAPVVDESVPAVPEKPVAEKSKKAKKSAKKSKLTKESRAATEELNKDASTGKNDEAVREAQEAVSDAKEKVSDKTVDVKKAETVAHNDDKLTDSYKKSMVAKEQKGLDEAKEELAKAEKKLEETTPSSKAK